MGFRGSQRDDVGMQGVALTAAQPVVGLALSVAGSGQGFTRTIVVGFIVSVLRCAGVILVDGRRCYVAA